MPLITFAELEAAGKRAKERLPGGLGDRRPDSAFDPKELARGMKVEMEHTDDPKKAKEITKDHLTEKSDYYSMLAEMEGKGGGERTPEVVVVHLFDSQGRLLVIERSDQSNRAGEWESPAGHVDEGETPEQAAVREVKEETGLPVLLFPRRGWFQLRDQEGWGIMFHGHVPGSTDSSKVKLNPKEHSRFGWLPLKKLEDFEREYDTPPDFAKNVRKMMKAMKPSKEASRRRAKTPSLADLGEDVREVVLVGDDVEIFLSAPSGSHPEVLEGTVDSVGATKFVLVNDEDGKSNSVDYRDRNRWQFIRIQRGGDVLLYQNHDPSHGDEEAVGGAKGLGLIFEPPKPAPWESVFRLMRGETPDMDHLSFAQAPKTMDVVAPSAHGHRVLQQVREVVETLGLDDDVTAHDSGNGRVLLLTTDPDTKAELKRGLKKHGQEVKETRTGALLVRPRKALMQQNPVTPTQPPAQPSPMSPQPDQVTINVPKLDQRSQIEEQFGTGDIQENNDGFQVMLPQEQMAQLGQTMRSGRLR